MDYENLFYQLKFHLAEIISKSELDSYELDQAKIDKIIKMMALSHELFDIAAAEPAPILIGVPENIPEVVAIHNSEKQVPEKVVEKEIFVDETSEDGTWYRGQLERKLRGGFIGKKELFIPEKEIREINAGHGDWIQADLLKKDARSHKNLYDYQLLEKVSAEETQSDRQAVDVTPVFYDEENSYYIKVAEQIVSLKEIDVIKFQIEAGDIIDYAYYDGKINDGKVAWRYGAQELPFSNKKIKW